jgi:hypothetical protein
MGTTPGFKYADTLLPKDIALYGNMVRGIDAVDNYDIEVIKNTISLDYIFYDYVFRKLPLSDLPLYINDNTISRYSLNIIKWRLKTGH